MHGKRFFGFLSFFCVLFFVTVLPLRAQEHEVWTDLGIYGGMIQDLAFDPADPARIFAAAYQGRGLYRSEDGGATWQALSMPGYIPGEDTFNEQSVYAVEAAPSNPDIVWAAHNYWVAKSSDGGQTWTHIFNSDVQRDCSGCGGDGDNWRVCLDIAIHPVDPDIVYVATTGPYYSDAEGAVYKTTDGGTTWRKTNQGGNLDYRVEDLAISPNSPDTLWAVTNSNGHNGAYTGSVYRSQNGGEAFSAVSYPPLPRISGGMMSVAPKPDDENTVFVGCGGGILHLDFDGAQWNASYPVEESRLANAVAFSPSRPDVVYISWMRPADSYWQGDGIPKVYRGVYDGASWHWTNPDSQGLAENAGRVLSLAVHPTDENTVVAGEAGLGVLRTGDAGARWTPVNDGLDAVIVYDLDADSRVEGHLLAASNAGVFERADSNAEWVRHLSGTFWSVNFHPSAAGTYFAGAQGVLYRTNDAGATWVPSSHLGFFFVEDIAADPVDPDRVYVATGSGGRQVLRSLDGGATFSPVLEGYTEENGACSVNTVLVDPNDPNRLFAGGGNFYSPYVPGALWQSKDGGDNWEVRLSDVIVNAVLVDPNDPDVVYAGCGHSYNYGMPPVFKSVDGGATWSPSTRGLPNKIVFMADLWAASAQYAVGVGADGRVLIYDGESAVIRESGVTSESLYGVFGLSPSQVWAVGENGTILYFDGTDWAAMESGITEYLNQVWAAAPDLVWAVGGGGTILRFDGTSWQPMDSDTTEGLNHIFGLAEDDIYAVGDKGTILHYNGTDWETMESGTSNMLTSVWGPDPSHVFAVGANETVLHFDGTGWNPIRTPLSDDTLHNVWGTGPDDLYVTSDTGSRVLHYDGVTWDETILEGAVDTRGVWGEGAGSIFVSDSYSGLYFFDGSRWETLRKTGDRFRSVTDLAAHPTDAEVVYAATVKAGVFVSPNQADNWLNLGTPSHSVYAIATGSLYAATGSGVYQLTGTGVVAGDVYDEASLANINGALVETDMGHQCHSLEGSYMMVLPAGIFDLFAIADEYERGEAEDVTVLGSDVTRQDFALAEGEDDGSDGDDGPGGGGGDSETGSSNGGGGSCFIHTLRFH